MIKKVLSYCDVSRCETTIKQQKLFTFMPKLQTYYHFKLKPNREWKQYNIIQHTIMATKTLGTQVS